jgi:hypothetical protein
MLGQPLEEQSDLSGSSSTRDKGNRLGRARADTETAAEAFLRFQ